MAEHNILGSNGEKLAVDYLKQHNYKILEINWRHKNLEIDIIAQQNNTLVIAEVKTRHTNFFGEPEEFINKAKQNNLIKAAEAYIQQNNINLEVRFDIVSVLFNNQAHKINHIPDAFYPRL